MKLSYFSYTNKGGRPNNEDSLRCQELDGRGVFVLADGLGGHQSGETASAIAVEAILAGASAAPSLDGGTLLNQLAEANRQVMEGQKEPGCEDMKTTAVVLGIETAPEDGALSDGSASSGEGRAAWAHVGDSRLYYFAGGELAAAIMCDAIVRLIPGAIGDEQSALSDSFQDNLLAPPVYTRPAEYKGWRVPDVLLSGHQRKIDEWKHEQSLERTRRLRPDLLE